MFWIYLGLTCFDKIELEFLVSLKVDKYLIGGHPKIRVEKDLLLRTKEAQNGFQASLL